MVRADTVNFKTKIRKKFETFRNDKDLITFYVTLLAKLFLKGIAYVGSFQTRDFIMNNVIVLAIFVAQFNDINDKILRDFLLFL